MSSWVAVGALGALGLIYVYGGYLGLLRLMVLFRRSNRVELLPTAPNKELPGLTVFFSAFNEEQLVWRRLENLAAQEYPRDRLEIVVVSDGSTDHTMALAEHFAETHPDLNVRVMGWFDNRGQYAAQNLVAREAQYEILVSTDADAEFAVGFLRAIGGAFLDAGVGVAGGVIRYREARSAIAGSIGTYRSMEHRLRTAEEALGVLAKTDGPCTAYRRGIWREIEEFEDVDHVVVIFARQSGLRAIQVTSAVCWDTANARWKQELRARARMTRKGLLSIHKRWGWRDFRREPLFSFALFSHRHVRFLSPGFLTVCVVGFGGALMGVGLFLPVIGVVVLLALSVGLSSAIGVPGTRRVVGGIGSFLLANAGFALGILGWLRGDRRGRYQPARQVQ